MNAALKAGKAGLQLNKKIASCTKKVALNGILGILKLKYPGIEEFLQCAKKIQLRVKVLCIMIHLYIYVYI